MAKYSPRCMLVPINLTRKTYITTKQYQLQNKKTLDQQLIWPNSHTCNEMKINDIFAWIITEINGSKSARICNIDGVIKKEDSIYPERSINDTSCKYDTILLISDIIQIPFNKFCKHILYIQNKTNYTSKSRIYGRVRCLISNKYIKMIQKNRNIKIV